MVEHLHHVVLDVTKVLMNFSKYVNLSCDEVTTLDNQSWANVRVLYGSRLEKSTHIVIFGTCS
jgi:hypothetical protein